MNIVIGILIFMFLSVLASIALTKTNSKDSDGDDRTIYYICNQERCEKCHPEFCHHTTDIRYAKNFECAEMGSYLEKKPDRNVDSQDSRQATDEKGEN